MSTVAQLLEDTGRAAHRVAWEVSHVLEAGTWDSPYARTVVEDAVTEWRQVSDELTTALAGYAQNPLERPGIRCRRCGLVDDTCSSCETRGEARKYGDDAGDYRP